MEFPTEIKLETAELPSDAWMVRPCEHYKYEYKDCSSIGGRFQQHFVLGASQECGQWKEDFNKCMTWRTTQDVEALKAVIKSEKIRKVQRLSRSLENDVWQLRSAPLSASEWNRPLPEYITQRQANSFLELMQENKSDQTLPKQGQSCVIL